MSEIRTCEEFVVARVQEQDGIIAELSDRVVAMDKIIKVKDAEIEFLLNQFKFEIKENNTGRFSATIWQEYDGEDYDKFFEVYSKYVREE